MKRLTEQDFYTLLGISPKASFDEVRSAYDEAVSIYSSDSVATYTLFTEKEREEILSRLLDAYKTLTNTQLRREYNYSLIEKGELSPEELGSSSAEDSISVKGKLRDVNAASLIQEEEKAQDYKQLPETDLDPFEYETPITGKSIKMLRTSKEISLEEIYRKTNIPKKTLEDIEEENFEELPAFVYLKGFLKNYAKILGIDETRMVNGYVKRYREWKNTFQK
jgi:DnaJ-class molecular chaperone